MAHEPKRRHSTERKGQRRAAIKLAVTTGNKCPNCGEMTRPHMTCLFCGFYKGKEIITKQKTSVKKVA